MSPEITAPHFVVPCDISPSVHCAANRKILSGRKDLQKSRKRSLLKLLFPYASGRRSTAGLLEQMPRSQDRRASARLDSSVTSPLRSTTNLTPRHSYALAKSKNTSSESKSSAASKNVIGDKMTPKTIITNPANPRRNSTKSRESVTGSVFFRAICQLRRPQAMPSGSSKIIAQENATIPSRPRAGKSARMPIVPQASPMIAKSGQVRTASNLSRYDWMNVSIKIAASCGMF